MVTFKGKTIKNAEFLEEKRGTYPSFYFFSLKMQSVKKVKLIPNYLRYFQVFIKISCKKFEILL